MFRIRRPKDACRAFNLIREGRASSRPASDFNGKAATFVRDIMVCRQGEEREVNAKSAVHILTLGLDKGSAIEISAEGPGERAAVDAPADLAAGFAE